MRIENYMKKAIIVGATSGIGKGLAELLVQNGYKVGITGRRINLLNDLKSSNPDLYIVKNFDVTDTKSTNKNLEELTTELGGLDLLIISSGTGDINETLDFQTEKQAIETNISGFTAVAGWTYNYFKNQNSGHLVAITSIGGLRGSNQAPAYNATKAYQINYLEGLRQKAKKDQLRIDITDIRPGLVDTDMAKGEGLFWISSVQKTSKQIYKAICRRKKIAYVTRRWQLIAILLKLLPGAIYERI
jgi:short-subunit dehydrogenase